MFRSIQFYNIPMKWLTLDVLENNFDTDRLSLRTRILKNQVARLIQCFTRGDKISYRYKNKYISTRTIRTVDKVPWTILSRRTLISGVVFPEGLTLLEAARARWGA